MKKIISGLLILSAVLLVSGCASKPQSGGSDMPDFVLNPPSQEDALFGIGSAKQSTEQMTITMADSRARQSLGFQLSANVQAMITDYAREAGTENNTASLEFAEVVGRQLVNVELRGATVVKREKMKDGTYWVLMSYNKAAAAQMAATVLETESSRYSEFKAKEALQLMEQQLSKTTTKPEPVTK
jgi:hypothetical protein